jgi:hypothetical protein
MKRWKIKCDNTQHISCPVYPIFLVEFGVWIWRTYELWLIIDGIVVALAACRLSCCLYVDMRSLVCWTGDASWSVVVTYSAWMKSVVPGQSLTLSTGQKRHTDTAPGSPNKNISWSHPHKETALDIAYHTADKITTVKHSVSDKVSTADVLGPTVSYVQGLQAGALFIQAE